MTFDALADHASTEERREIFRRHKASLLGIGIVTGYLGAAPSIVWASGALFAAAFVILVPVAIWIYTLVFAFSSLWFSHYCLAALEKLRAQEAAAVLAATPAVMPAPEPLALADDPAGTSAADIGLIIVGDEILSGKRSDKHLPKVIELLAQRGLSLSWVRLVGDDRDRITATLREAFAGGDVVFSCGGIGATPDDHTRQCAAAALGVDLVLHPEARQLIEAR
eukprot:gene8226-10467_t